MTPVLGSFGEGFGKFWGGFGEEKTLKKQNVGGKNVEKPYRLLLFLISYYVFTIFIISNEKTMTI